MNDDYYNQPFACKHIDTSNKIESNYDAACRLAQRNYARVTFEEGGVTWTVEPLRLARKIQKLEKALMRLMASGISTLPIDDLEYAEKALNKKPFDIVATEYKGNICC